MKRRAWILAIVIAAAAAAAWVIPNLGEEPAVAGLPETAKLDDYGKYVVSDAPIDLRLMALDALRKKNATGVVAQLDAIAKSKDTQIAIYATTALGKKGGSSAKAKLKALLESSSRDVEVRLGALSAIAHHWEDENDLSYLEEKADGNTRLETRLAWLEENVYEK